jgi:hypothetical protein
MSPSTAEPNGSYLDQSRLGRGSGGFYLLGLMIILFSWLIAGSLVAVGVSLLLTGAELPPDSTPAWQRLTVDLLPSVAMLVGVLVVVRWVLARPTRTVVTGRPRISVRRMLVAGSYRIRAVTLSMYSR